MAHSRRPFLAFLAAIPAAFLLKDDPHAALVAERDRAGAVFDATTGDDDAARAWRRCLALDLEIATTPPKSREGLRAIAEVLRRDRIGETSHAAGDAAFEALRAAL